MNDLITHAVTVFLAFFAVMNPIANTASFAALAGQETRGKQIKIAIKSLVIAFIIILLFSILGKLIFHVFGITLPALRITGGILIFLIGYHMLQGKSSKLHTMDNSADATDVSITPLAIPLLAGPGTIATAMNYSASGEVGSVLVTIAVFSILCLITFIAFVFSGVILKAIGTNILNIVTRLMGLILAVIGTQMFIDGSISVSKLLH